jgi:hypothetical protein
MPVSACTAVAPGAETSGGIREPCRTAGLRVVHSLHCMIGLDVGILAGPAWYMDSNPTSAASGLSADAGR